MYIQTEFMLMLFLLLQTVCGGIGGIILTVGMAGDGLTIIGIGTVGMVPLGAGLMAGPAGMDRVGDIIIRAIGMEPIGQAVHIPIAVHSAHGLRLILEQCGAEVGEEVMQHHLLTSVWDVALQLLVVHVG